MLGQGFAFSCVIRLLGVLTRSKQVVGNQPKYTRFFLWLTSLLCALTAGTLPPGSFCQCGSMAIRLPVSTSHRSIELSLLPEKAVVSSGDSTTHVGVSLCPRICRTAELAICCPCKPFATCGGSKTKGGYSACKIPAVSRREKAHQADKFCSALVPLQSQEQRLETESKPNAQIHRR